MRQGRPFPLALSEAKNAGPRTAFKRFLRTMRFADGCSGRACATPQSTSYILPLRLGIGGQMAFKTLVAAAFLVTLHLAPAAAAKESHGSAAPDCALDGRAEAGGYWLDATLSRGADAWILTPQTNIRFAPDQYGGAAVPGAGHIHLYLNGKLIGPITHAGPISVPLLDRETYIVKLALTTSDHNEANFGVCREVRVAAPVTNN
jgi:hypothetical protein